MSDQVLQDRAQALLALHQPGNPAILPTVWDAWSARLATNAGFTSDPVLPFFLERYAAAYRAELDAFVTAVASGKAPKPDGEDGLKALLLADAATASAKTGQTVTL